MKDKTKREISPLHPGWLEREAPASYADEELKRIVLFYVIYTPCPGASAKGIPIETYGWDKSVWTQGRLRKQLLSAASLEKHKTFFSVKTTAELKDAFTQAKMRKGFHRDRSVEKIVFYKGKDNEVLSIFRHIRNALAHGRLAMYACGEDEKDIIFVLEDGVPGSGNYIVNSRMILKKSTLLKWIDIIKQGPASLETENERKRKS